MSHKNKKSLKLQSYERLKPMLSFGRSKAADKKAAGRAYDARYGVLKAHGIKPPVTKQEYVRSVTGRYIYSISTFRNYEKQINYFLDYCKKVHHCRTLDQCRDYASEWLCKRVEDGLSASTIKQAVSALGKLYGVCGREFGVSVSRRRANIKRSRGEAVRDRDFSCENNAELIRFCKSTGLRRSELSALKPEQLGFFHGRPYLVVKGKGGRVRRAPIIGDVDAVVARIRNTPSGCKVWERIPSHADIHSYRACYAADFYAMLARDISTLPKAERYYCRNDKKGVVYDREAMAVVSKALGHNRVSVIAGHYLYTLAN